MKFTPPDVALLTPAGRGAVATLLLRGTGESLSRVLSPFFRAANHRRLDEQSLQRIVFGHWISSFPGTAEEPSAITSAESKGEGDAWALAQEDVVICRRSEAEVEVHCHGGRAAVRRLLQDLERAGCQVLPWQEQLARYAGPYAAECRDTLALARTVRMAEIVLWQESQGLRRTLRDLVQQTCTIEVSRRKVLHQLAEIQSWQAFGLHLVQPWRVVLCGRPNVGKSSLLNALLGYQRSIVDAVPGTTRDVVTGGTAWEGWPVELADTAGLREGATAVEAAGIELARSELATADSLLLVLDLSEPLSAVDRQLLWDLPHSLVAANKQDRSAAWSLADVPGAVAVSAQSGEGLDSLVSRILAGIVPRIPTPDSPIPFTARQRRLLEEARQGASAGDEGTFQARIHELLR